MTVPEFHPVLTTVGRDAVAEAHANGQTLPVTKIAIGTGSYVPTGDETALAAEQDRANIHRSDYEGGGVWRVAATVEGTSNYIAWEAAFFIEVNGQDVPLFILSSTERSFTAVSEGAKTTIELHVALGVLPEGAVEIQVLDADPVTYDVLDDMSGQHLPGNNFNFALTRNLKEHMYSSMEQFELLAQIRRGYGQSGIRMGRHYAYGGDAAYHRPSVAAFASFGVHNHPNYPLMCGMPEITAIVNGHEVNTRHIDYKIIHSIGDAYLAVEDAVPPPVPPSVAAQAAPEDQITEMREYLRAFGAKDTGIRDYRPYFDTYLSVLEVWLENLDGDQLVDTFPSFRHQLSNLGHKHMNDDYIALMASGLKPRFENDDFKPTVVRVMRPDGAPQFAVLRYRVSAVRLGNYGEYPAHLMTSQVDDPVTRQATGNSDAQMDANRLGRYRVNYAIGDDSIARRSNPGLLDEIMSKVPGLDGLGAVINEDYTDTSDSGAEFVQRLMNFKTSDLMNSACYARFYSYEHAGAAGRRNYRFGYNDPFLFRAATTRQEVTSIPGMGGGHRISWAIPMELIVASPLASWNPYSIAEGGWPTGNGNSQATAFSNAHRNGRWYMTPSVLFDGAGAPLDPADTDAAAWMMCGDGQARLMRGSGVYVHMPEIQGVQTARIRYPIAPVHHEGSFEFGHMEAVRKETQRALAALANEIHEMKHTARYGGNNGA
ncbi:phage tail protein [Leisingera sp. D0M16]|uniref:phage tail-collar fiber domain-containing protein n=1 Tax=Leisingera coralii TaxID=3351347 RepID=UPI003B809293